jgi:MoxR-like ATPase
MNVKTAEIDKQFEVVYDELQNLNKVLANAIVGQDRLIVNLLTAFFAKGHILLEGLPGLGKTHLAKGLAAGVDLPLSRIQCTPDLIPADITGSEILNVDKNARDQLVFRHGPIFSSMVLVDEINRATPKTQAALLEAMQEKQVTYIGNQYKLPKLFWILATQNPIELEGTYPLPEAQLDRFMMKLVIEPPSSDAWLNILDVTLDDEPSEHIHSIISPTQLQMILDLTRQVVIAQPIKQAAVDFILSCHPENEHAGTLSKKHIHYGPSPRGLQSLVRAARVLALFNGRAHVSMADLEALIIPVLRHRILLTIESEMQGTTVETVLNQLIEEWLKRH